MSENIAKELINIKNQLAITNKLKIMEMRYKIYEVDDLKNIDEMEKIVEYHSDGDYCP